MSRVSWICSQEHSLEEAPPAFICVLRPTKWFGSLDPRKDSQGSKEVGDKREFLGVYLFVFLAVHYSLIPPDRGLGPVGPHIVDVFLLWTFSGESLQL